MECPGELWNMTGEPPKCGEPIEWILDCKPFIEIMDLEQMQKQRKEINCLLQSRKEGRLKILAELEHFDSKTNRLQLEHDDFEFNIRSEGARRQAEAQRKDKERREQLAELLKRQCERKERQITEKTYFDIWYRLRESQRISYTLTRSLEMMRIPLWLYKQYESNGGPGDLFKFYLKELYPNGIFDAYDLSKDQ